MKCISYNGLCALKQGHHGPCHLGLSATGDSGMQASATGSLRDNKGKAPVAEVPLELLEAVAMVLYKSSIPGGGKYPARNWRKGNSHSVPLNSLIRHAMKLAGGETHDAESGMAHSWHIACNAAFLVFYEKHFPELNDLATKEEK